MDHPKKISQKSQSFLSKRQSCDADQKVNNNYQIFIPKGPNSIERIENILCPALEMMSKTSPGTAKRTVYFPSEI